jgi:hypothetical protein
LSEFSGLQKGFTIRCVLKGFTSWRGETFRAMLKGFTFCKGETFLFLIKVKPFIPDKGETF